MAADQQHEMQRDLVALVRQWPGEWSEIRVHVCVTAQTIQLSIGADIRLPRGPKGISRLIEPLRTSMADPVRGAWLMADIVIPRAGEPTFQYDWMNKPDWPGTGGTFSDYDNYVYVQDLKAFPRAPEHIPDWYPDAETVTPPTEYVDSDAERPPPPPPRVGDDPDVALTGLSFPTGMALDAAGALYTSDTGNDRVVLLSAGSTEPVVLPFDGLSEPCGVTVDDAGTVYVADSVNDRVLALAAGETDIIEIPLGGLRYPGGIAVDASGALYVTDRINRQILTLPRGAVAPTVLPFPGLRWLIDVAVDDTGTVYVADRAHNTNDAVGGRILTLAPGAEQPIELANGLQILGGIAVDAAGDVYVTESVTEGRVLKLSGGAFSIIASRLHKPAGLALDGAGTIYIAEMPSGDESAERSRGRILKRPIP